METLSFWTEKYQPKSLEALDDRGKSKELLEEIARSVDFPHMIIYGADGVGKKTRIKALLTKIFGAGVQKVQRLNKELKVNSSTIEYQILSSNYHIGIIY